MSTLERLGLSAIGLVALGAGCTFPDVNFAAWSPDGGQSMGQASDASGDATVAFPDPDAVASDDASDLDAGISDAGTEPLPDGACNYNGTWGSLITIDVSWTPQGLNGIILAAGTGHIRQWVKGTRVQHSTALSDTTVVCGIELPDFKETVVVGNETYGVRFPGTLFDDSYLPSFVVNGAVGDLMPGATYSTTTTAVLLGMTMAHPTIDPWPAAIDMQADMDQDGKPGVTAYVAEGTGYQNIPVGLPTGPFQPIPRASKVYLAIRQITVVSATVQDCNTMTGTVDIPALQTSPGNAKPAIDSHILGCALADGGDCTASGTSSQAAFVDNTQPVFTPTGTTSFRSTRLRTGATCADVRGAF